MQLSVGHAGNYGLAPMKWRDTYAKAAQAIVALDDENRALREQLANTQSELQAMKINKRLNAQMAASQNTVLVGGITLYDRVTILCSIAEEVFGLEQGTVIKQDRNQTSVLARSVVAQIMRNIMDLTWVTSGQMIKRDHATVINLIKRFDQASQSSHDYRVKYHQVLDRYQSKFTSIEPDK